mmetsp:Transcript_9431/g.15250  ORF Transcript_9431/g.15250 Transcript_9431/m.15250 type:complete len:651 (+) Transcript_9431:54-2006(+)
MRRCTYFAGCWLFVALTPFALVEAVVSALPSTSRTAPAQHTFGLSTPPGDGESIAVVDGALMRREPMVDASHLLSHSKSQAAPPLQTRDRKTRRVFRRRSRLQDKLNGSSSLLVLSGGTVQQQMPLAPQSQTAFIPAVAQMPNLQMVQSLPFIAVPIAQPQTVQMIIQAPQAPVAPQAPTAPQAPVAPQAPAAVIMPPVAPPLTVAPAAVVAPATDTSAASYYDSDGSVEHRISMTTLLCIILSGTIVALYVAWRNLKKVYELRRGQDILSEMLLGLAGDGADGKGLFARVSVVSAYFAGTPGDTDDSSDKARSRSEKESEDSVGVGSRRPSGGRPSIIRGSIAMAGADVAAGGPEAETAPKAAPTSYRERKSRTRQSGALAPSNAREAGADTGAGDATTTSSQPQYRERRARGTRSTTPTAETAPSNETPTAESKETASRAEERTTPVAGGGTPAAASSYRERKSHARDPAATQPLEPSLENEIATQNAESRRERSRVHALQRSSGTAAEVAPQTAPAVVQSNQIPQESNTTEVESLASQEAAKAAADRVAAENAAKEEADRAAAEKKAKMEADSLEKERVAKAEAERLAAERAAEAEANRRAAEKAAQEEAKAEADRLAAENAAKAEADRLADEQAKNSDESDVMLEF